jgi:hypothetical protein
VWPRLGVGEHLEELFGADGEVHRTDEPERRAVDEVEADTFARMGLRHG